MKVDQRLMRLAAEKQAKERSERDRVACVVWLRGETWYVRTVDESAPEGASFEFAIVPS